MISGLANYLQYYVHRQDLRGPGLGAAPPDPRVSIRGGALHLPTRRALRHDGPLDLQAPVGARKRGPGIEHPPRPIRPLPPDSRPSCEQSHRLRLRALPRGRTLEERVTRAREGPQTRGRDQMRNPVWRIDGAGANALEGRVVWAPAKSMWNSLMFAVALGL